MDKLRAMELFVRLADLGSFTAVASEKGTSKSTISKEIGRLEEEMGARLLHRSTRNTQLTPVGEGFLEKCRRILVDVEEAESFVQEQHGKPGGKLRITAPMALGITDLSRMFSDFMLAYPEIELDIDLNDASQDLIQNGYDVGFRAASTTFDSSYVGRPLIDFSYKVLVSPDYFDKHSEITTPQDLIKHRCFIYAYFRGKDTWPLAEGIQISGPLKVNNTIFMMEFIKRGLGIGFIPDFVCRDAIEKGEVISILDQVERPSLTLYALYPARHYIPLNLRTCIDFMETWFKKEDQRLKKQLIGL